MNIKKMICCCILSSFGITGVYGADVNRVSHPIKSKAPQWKMTLPENRQYAVDVSYTFAGDFKLDKKNQKDWTQKGFALLKGVANTETVCLATSGGRTIEMTSLCLNANHEKDELWWLLAYKGTPSFDFNFGLRQNNDSKKGLDKLLKKVVLPVSGEEKRRAHELYPDIKNPFLLSLRSLFSAEARNKIRKIRQENAKAFMNGLGTVVSENSQRVISLNDEESKKALKKVVPDADKAADAIRALQGIAASMNMSLNNRAILLYSRPEEENEWFETYYNLDESNLEKSSKEEQERCGWSEVERKAWCKRMRIRIQKSQSNIVRIKKTANRLSAKSLRDLFSIENFREIAGSFAIWNDYRAKKDRFGNNDPIEVGEEALYISNKTIDPYLSIWGKTSTGALRNPGKRKENEAWYFENAGFFNMLLTDDFDYEFTGRVKLQLLKEDDKIEVGGETYTCWKIRILKDATTLSLDPINKHEKFAKFKLDKENEEESFIWIDRKSNLPVKIELQMVATNSVEDSRLAIKRYDQLYVKKDSPVVLRLSLEVNSIRDPKSPQETLSVKDVFGNGK